MKPEDTDHYLKNFVYISEGSAEYLREKGIACLAVDALSADRPGAPIDDHPVHRTLLPADILIVEGVDHLETVEPGRYDVVCTPIPYEDRDGSQVRFLVRSQ